MKTCETCGITYDPWRTTSRFCSLACSGGSRRKGCQHPGCTARPRHRGLCTAHFNALPEVQEEKRLYMREYNRRPEVVAAYAERYRAMPHRYAEAELRRKYSMTLAERSAMQDAQGGRCAVCGEVAKLHVDHCHVTNRVRGLLCGSCNRGLGHFKDDPALLAAAAAYLERHRG